MIIRWILSDRKSPQLSRTLLSILAVLNNAVVWMVYTRPPTSKYFSAFSNSLVTVPNAPFTIVIIVTCNFHRFFNSLARPRYLSFFSHSLSFILWSAGTAKSTILRVLFFLFLFFCWLLLSLVFWPRLDDLCVCQSRCWVVHIPFVCIVKIKFLAHLHPVVPSLLPSALICCIRLSRDWWFRLCHRIAYKCYFVASYIFLLWYDWFLWRCLLLVFGEILFLS